MKKIVFLLTIAIVSLIFFSCTTTQNDVLNNERTALEIGMANHYVDLLGLSRIDLEKIIKVEPLPLNTSNEIFTYQIIPGNMTPTNLVQFYINSEKGVFRIVTMHEYNNNWIKNKVDEFTRIYGRPDVRDDVYAFIVERNENGMKLITVYSSILRDTRYGIITTMIIN